MVPVTANVKKLFFDRRSVMDAVDAATRKVLSFFGGRVRLFARNSIKDTDKVSLPGQPPSSHVGAQRRAANRRLKAAGKPPVRGGFKGIKHILYAYDPMNRSVVIGPVAKDSYGVVPPLLEEGGTGDVQYHGRIVRGHFRARPFMGPSFRKVQPELPRLWSGSVVAKS